MMNQKRLFVLFLIVGAIGLLWYWMSMARPADTIFVNGKIRTLSADMPFAEALAVREGKIVGVGTSQEVRERFEAATEIDLEGRSVIPGLIDAHAHFVSLGVAMMTVDLVGATSAQEAAGRVRKRILEAPAGQWIRGRGWDQNLWKGFQFPTHQVLDRVAPEQPVILNRIDGHALWVNARAMELAGITRSTQDPPGGRIVRDAAGDPTGIFIDNAKDLITRVVPLITVEEVQEAVLLAQRKCLSLGLTGVHDMGVDEEDVSVFKDLIDKDSLKIRIYAAVGGTGPLWERMKREGPLVGFGNGRLSIRTLKLYADGALGSRGAALIEPYSDDPGNRGLTVTSQEELQQLVDEAVATGFQVSIHAIGDRGNNIVLNVYESVLARHGQHDQRLRVEHAQVLHPEDIPRFRTLNILPSMQPTHCTSDMYWAEARLGPQRIRGAYAWRSLRETGVIIPSGSDFPVEYPDPFAGIYAAVTRRDKLGRPDGAANMKDDFQFSSAGMTDPADFTEGWYGSQKLTLDEALRGFTTWAAYAAFEEDRKGSLESGKLADFVVLNGELLDNSPQSILSTSVRATYIAGQKVYDSNLP